MNHHPEQLASRAATSPDAFTDLYDCYFKRVYNYIRLRCNDTQTTDDLCAQVFERLLQKIGQYDPGRGPFEPWLFAIVRNTVNGYYRKQRFSWLPFDSLRTQPYDSPPLEEVVIIREDKADLLKALCTLDTRSRDIIGLKFAAGLNSSQIAQVTGLSESNVRVIQYRAIKQLHAVLAGVEKASSGQKHKELEDEIG